MPTALSAKACETVLNEHTVKGNARSLAPQANPRGQQHKHNSRQPDQRASDLVFACIYSPQQPHQRKGGQ
jgi:hypothetical protein